MCDYCDSDSPCTHPACACSLSGPRRCPACGHDCRVWHFGLALQDAPPSIDGFLGSVGSENPGYDRFPATKLELVAAARAEIEDSGGSNAADITWLDRRLPDGTYQDQGEVFSALQGPITTPRLELPAWFAQVGSGALPLGTRLVVASGGTALLLGRNRAGLDVFPPGEYQLTRDTAPLAAAGSRAPAPGFTRGVLECSVVFFSTQDQQGELSVHGVTKTGQPIYLDSKVRFSLSDPKKFAGSPGGLAYSTPAGPDQTLARIVAPALTTAVRAHEPGALSTDPTIAEGIVRRALGDAGFVARSVQFGYIGSSPVGRMMASGGPDPFARLPPEARAMIQARMEEAMQHRPPPGDRSATSARAPASGAPVPSATPAVVCPACHAPNPASGKFCLACGAPLAAQRKCPACGGEVGAGVKFCGACGTRLA